MNDATHTLSPEWYNENALRAYPLRDDCRAASTVPTWLIADMRVTADSSYSHVFVRSVYLSATLVSVSVGGVTQDGTEIGLLARTVTRDELEPWRAYSMERLGGTAYGTIVFGEIPTGAEPFRHVFTGDDSPLAANAVVPVKAPGVTRIVDRAHGAYAAGIIDLSGNSEFRTYLDPDDESGRTIVIELTDLYRDLTTSVCSATPSFDNCGETPVRSINGVKPDEEGVLRLEFR